jgi:hypothetical protein
VKGKPERVRAVGPRDPARRAQGQPAGWQREQRREAGPAGKLAREREKSAGPAGRLAARAE